MEFQEVFDHQESGKGAGDRRLSLNQEKQSTSDNALSFCTLSAESRWNGLPLTTFLRQGLSNLSLHTEITLSPAIFSDPVNLVKITDPVPETQPS